MAVALNDGGLGYGSKVFTLNAITYVGNSIKMDLPTVVLEQRDEINEPSGQVLTNDFVTGSATLQLANAATVLPTRGMAFTIDLRRAGSNQNYAISKVSPAYDQGALQVCDVEFRAKIN